MGRGRPRKNPVVVETPVVEAPVKKKRGRPPKNKTVVDNKPVEQTVETPVAVEESVKGLNEALLEIYEEAKELLGAESNNTILSRYELGKLVSKVHADTGNVYGAKAVEKLSRALGQNKTILYDAEKFTEVYSEEELDVLVNVRNSKDQPLTWSHVEALIHVADDEDREQMLTEALANSWSAAELSKKIASKFGKKSNSPGRKLAKPQTFDGYLESIISTSEIVTKKAAQVWLGDERVKVEDPSDLTDVMANKLQAALDSLGDVVAACTKTAEELNALRDSLAAKVEAAKKPAKKTAKPVEPEDDEELDDEDDQSEDDATEDDADDEADVKGLPDDEFDDDEFEDDDEEELEDEDEDELFDDEEEAPRKRR